MKPTFNNLHTDFIFSMLRGTAAINEKKGSWYNCQGKIPYCCISNTLSICAIKPNLSLYKALKDLNSYDVHYPEVDAKQNNRNDRFGVLLKI